MSREQSFAQDEFSTGPALAAGKCGRPLLRCLQVTALAIAIVTGAGTGARAEQPLSAQDIKRQIIGHGFEGRKGIIAVTLHYGKDGTVTMRTPFGAGEGSWTLSDNQLCVTLPSGPRKGSECLTFTSQAEGEYRASNGLRLKLRQ